MFQRIAAKEEKGADPAKIRNYRAFELLASYTGLRPRTIQRLTVGQFTAALDKEKPVLHVLAEQEKNRVEHYVPLHPFIVSAISEVLAHDFGEKKDGKPFFLFNSFEKWLERQKIPLPQGRDPSEAHLWLSDFRKFAEQFGDTISWDATLYMASIWPPLSNCFGSSLFQRKSGFGSCVSKVLRRLIIRRFITRRS